MSQPMEEDVEEEMAGNYTPNQLMDRLISSADRILLVAAANDAWKDAPTKLLGGRIDRFYKRFQEVADLNALELGDRFAEFYSGKYSLICTLFVDMLDSPPKFVRTATSPFKNFVQTMSRFGRKLALIAAEDAGATKIFWEDTMSGRSGADVLSEHVLTLGMPAKTVDWLLSRYPDHEYMIATGKAICEEKFHLTYPKQIEEDDED